MNFMTLNIRMMLPVMFSPALRITCSKQDTGLLIAAAQKVACRLSLSLWPLQDAPDPTVTSLPVPLKSKKALLLYTIR